MIRNVLETIGGVANYGIIAICLFFLAFSAALLWACLLRKPFLQSMSRLPLEDQESTPPSPSDERSQTS